MEAAVTANPVTGVVSAINSASERFARCIETSKRVRWEIDEVIGGRSFDLAHKFLPDGLSKVDELDFLSAGDQRYLSQIQGRTYAYIFGLVERFIAAKVLEKSRDYWLGDQVALEALIRFADEELKHQELFRRLERLMDSQMKPGYTMVAEADDVAKVVLSKSNWAVLALTLHIELFTQVHYRESIDPDTDLSPLFKDVFLFHWKEESQHAIMDEIEWKREHAEMGPEAHDQAVTDFIDLVVAVDGILQAQSAEDARYFCDTCGRDVPDDEREKVRAGLLKAYRWQYILSGATHPSFQKALSGMLTEEQGARLTAAVGTLM